MLCRQCRTRQEIVPCACPLMSKMAKTNPMDCAVCQYRGKDTSDCAVCQHCEYSKTFACGQSPAELGLQSSSSRTAADHLHPIQLAKRREERRRLKPGWRISTLWNDVLGWEHQMYLCATRQASSARNVNESAASISQSSSTANLRHAVQDE